LYSKLTTIRIAFRRLYFGEMSTAPKTRARYGTEARPVSVIDAMARSLRRRVLSGELAPGTELPEFELASDYAVARPTARAALQQLALSGLVRREANRSARVPRLTAEEIVDLFGARALVELEALRRTLAKRVQPELARRALGRLEAASTETDWSEVVEMDLEFHRGLVAAAGSSWLSRMFGVLEDEIRLAISQLRPAYGSPGELAAEHRLLLGSISGDGSADPRDLLVQHLERAVSDLTGLQGPET
jgi:DNA-binding GntR family transcriptional regulator